MTIKEQFNKIASEYDGKRRLFIPCFDDFYRAATDFIAANIAPPERILDLGAGTGILSAFFFEHFPKAEFVLVDVADEMLGVARKRFEHIQNITYQTADYSEKLPDGTFGCVISALSIHHLEHPAKENLFRSVRGVLADGGVFVNYDQFSAGSPLMNRWFDSTWEKTLRTGGLSEKDISLWQERRKFDRECSVEEECAMLHHVGFSEVKCVYANRKFAVIVAVR